MDPRADPADFFAVRGLVPIFRNAGGRVSEDALRSIRVLSGINANGRNTVNRVVIVHHADCGLLNFSNGEVAQCLIEHAKLEDQRVDEVRGLEFGELKGPADEAMKADLRTVKNDPYLPKDIEVIGVMYDVFSGEAKEVARL